MNNSRGYGVGFGKYVIVDDVFNNPESTYYNFKYLVWWKDGKLMTFNGDGRDDILVYESK